MLGYEAMQKKSNMLRIVQCATLRMWYVSFKLFFYFLIFLVSLHIYWDTFSNATTNNLLRILLNLL